MAAKRTVTHPKRGEIYLVSFDPTIGAEIQKTRPALVLQNNVSNEYSPITIVAAISSKFDETLYPTEVLIQPPEGGMTVNSVVLLNQIRSIDKQRLIRKLGELTFASMERVNEAIQISLGLTEIE
ncbi:mRNA interferase PemK [Dulcicalothrix desertica PCC 7102]|uniref:mRNA interferase n=1 Tax=Dulcicalothrix desertica PCC 7102 TaxID=232991 RepID=A0A3S1BZP0_9CYAN|nr:type II toxin-antitoxin system PemK/MazF family toxin [Dulcicalothrix desertica]RUS97614.1 mRNA interferase PemK [Dulcicalothrix desertica PCC 7102]TWH54824.1 mRNA interferase MazF [Dulcicalothrix desertica PCC 7102]